MNYKIINYDIINQLHYIKTEKVLARSTSASAYDPNLSSYFSCLNSSSFNSNPENLKPFWNVTPRSFPLTFGVVVIVTAIYTLVENLCLQWA